MAAASWLRYAYLAHGARPRSNRALYRMVKRERIYRIVEIGITDLGRSRSLIEVAQRYTNDKKVMYTGFDMFEARSEKLRPLVLKDTYCELRATEATIRLVPGVPRMSLASAANAHPNTGLLLIGPDIADDDLRGGWFYVPRMLYERSIVLREQREADGQMTFAPIDRSMISELAAREAVRRAA
ncbi:MAG: hypothetical protein IT425_07390 [Pirellulales bacterium]|nr:hypothetical protein [Pirellulales bacterium]